MSEENIQTLNEHRYKLRRAVDELKTKGDYKENSQKILYFYNDKVLDFMPVIFSKYNYGHFNMPVKCKMVLDKIKDKNEIKEHVEELRECEEFIDVGVNGSEYGSELEKIETLLEMILDYCPWLNKLPFRHLQ